MEVKSAARDLGVEMFESARDLLDDVEGSVVLLNTDIWTYRFNMPILPVNMDYMHIKSLRPNVQACMNMWVVWRLCANPLGVNSRKDS